MALFEHKDLPQRRSDKHRVINLRGIGTLFVIWLTIAFMNYDNPMVYVPNLMIYLVLLYLWSFRLSYVVLGWATRNYKRDLDDVYYDIRDVEQLVNEPIDGIVDPLVMQRYEELHAERRILLDEQIN